MAEVWRIKLQTQSPKSPDLNVLDLSIFWALQSHQWRSGFANNIDELVEQVQRAYLDFEPQKLDFSFQTLQCCMDDVLSTYSNNDYKIWHMGKEVILRGGILPMSIVPSTSALEVFHMMEREVGATTATSLKTTERSPGCDRLSFMQMN